MLKSDLVCTDFGADKTYCGVQVFISFEDMHSIPEQNISLKHLTKNYYFRKFMFSSVFSYHFLLTCVLLLCVCSQVRARIRPFEWHRAGGWPLQPFAHPCTRRARAAAHAAPGVACGQRPRPCMPQGVLGGHSHPLGAVLGRGFCAIVGAGGWLAERRPKGNRRW